MYNKRDIFTHAWNIKRKAQRWTFSTCLKKAWAAAKAKENAPTLKLVEPTKETDKALGFHVTIECVTTNDTIKRWVWMPKSQITDGAPADWIVNTKLKDLRNDLGRSINVYGLTTETLVAA